MLRQKARDDHRIACNDNGRISAVEQRAAPSTLGILAVATKFLGAVCLDYVADCVLIISPSQQFQAECRWPGTLATPEHLRSGLREIARRSLMSHQHGRMVAEG